MSTVACPDVSLVVPVHNESSNLPRLFEAIRQNFAGIDYEIIAVDDGSTDRSWSIIADAAASDPHIRGVRFGRNFGHQAALSSGLREAIGRAVITLDADLQDPPSVARAMVALWGEGYDVVEARRTGREGETIFKRLTAHLYYRLLRMSATQPLSVDVGDFRLLSRRAVDAVNALPERERYLRGIVAWLGMSRTEVVYSRPARVAGSTSYSLSRMLALAASGVIGCTDLPIRVSALLAVALIALACACVGGAVATSGDARWGFALSSMAALQMATVLAACSACLLYLGRITSESIARPAFLVAERTITQTVATPAVSLETRLGQEQFSVLGASPF